MKYVITVTKMRTRKARFDKNGTDQLNTLKKNKKNRNMLRNAKMYTLLLGAFLYSQECGLLILVK